MSIKFLTKSEEQDIYVGLTRKIRYNRHRLNHWLKNNQEHPQKEEILAKKNKRIKQLEDLRSRFAIAYQYLMIEDAHAPKYQHTKE